MMNEEGDGIGNCNGDGSGDAGGSIPPFLHHSFSSNTPMNGSSLYRPSQSNP